MNSSSKFSRFFVMFCAISVLVLVPLFILHTYIDFIKICNVQIIKFHNSLIRDVWARLPIHRIIFIPFLIKTTTKYIKFYCRRYDYEHAFIYSKYFSNNLFQKKTPLSENQLVTRTYLNKRIRKFANFVPLSTQVLREISLPINQLERTTV